MILNEGGNIFKDPETKEPVTQRINQADVDPTLAWLEKITGLPHKDFKLGSTGIRSTSGDMDIAVNQDEVTKDEMVAKLAAWVQKNHPGDDLKKWIRKSGINVHFLTPINGNPEEGYVQTDLMFGEPEFMKFALKGSGDNTPYKGQHRMILISSIAKAQGYKFSSGAGLVDRITNQTISKNPDEIAKTLMGDTATAKDMDSVETIIAKIKTDPNYENLIKDARDNFEKNGLELPK
jgi:hypothetical protein|tara:strand:+ start:484 stop:1188 length:705 start_codon:yes stop_codon:yes gene_type:complete